MKITWEGVPDIGTQDSKCSFAGRGDRQGEEAAHTCEGNTDIFKLWLSVVRPWFTWLRIARTTGYFVCGKQNPHSSDRTIRPVAYHGQAALRKGQTPRDLNSYIIRQSFGKCDFYPFLPSLAGLREENNPLFPPLTQTKLKVEGANSAEGSFSHT